MPPATNNGLLLRRNNSSGSSNSSRSNNTNSSLFKGMHTNRNSNIATGTEDLVAPASFSEDQFPPLGLATTTVTMTNAAASATSSAAAGAAVVAAATGEKAAVEAAMTGDNNSAPTNTNTTLLFLDLSHNALHELPKGLARLRALRRLDLSSNELQYLDFTATAAVSTPAAVGHPNASFEAISGGSGGGSDGGGGSISPNSHPYLEVTMIFAFLETRSRFCCWHLS
jgi:hypothetical protein